MMRLWSFPPMIESTLGHVSAVQPPSISPSASVGRVTEGKSTAPWWRSVALVNNGGKCHSQGWRAVWCCSTRKLCSSLCRAPAFRIPSLTGFFFTSPPQVNPSYSVFLRRGAEMILLVPNIGTRLEKEEWKHFNKRPSVFWLEPVSLCVARASVRESRSLCYL